MAMATKQGDDKSKQKSRQDFISEIATLKAQLQEVPLNEPQIFLTDVTPEALQDGLVQQKERQSILTDEGNLFDILGGMYTGGKQNLDVYLQGHAGGPLRVKRRGRVADLNKIAVSIGLVVQPAVLSEQSEKDRRKFRGKGLLARFAYCLPKSNIGGRDIRMRQAIPANVKAAYTAGVKALLVVRPNYNQHGVEAAHIIGLDENGKSAWQRFAQWIENNQGSGGKFERLQDFTGKLPGTALRIAGLCHVAERLGSKDDTLSSSSASSNIGLKNLEHVLDLCERLIVHAQAAFDLMGDDPVIADAKYTLKWIFKNTERNEQGAHFIRQNALHSCSRYKNSKLERVTKALDVLRERHITSGQYKLATRKPTYIFYVNPAIFEKVD
jgi:putative DNA primase/helicase